MKRLLPESGYDSVFLSYWMLLLCMVAHWIYTGTVFDWKAMNYDAETCLDAWDYLKQGKLDVFRTPLYPIFMGVNRHLFGQWWIEACVAQQWLWSMVGVVYFGKAANLILDKPRLSFWLSVVFGLFIGFQRFNELLHTESIASCIMVFFIYNLVKASRFGRAKDVLWSGFWAIFGVMLKPALLILPFSLLCWGVMEFFVRGHQTRRCGIVATVAAAAVFGAVWLYAWDINRNYGIFAISQVSDFNKFQNLRTDGMLNASDYPYDNHREELSKIMKPLAPDTCIENLSNIVMYPYPVQVGLAGNIFYDFERTSHLLTPTEFHDFVMVGFKADLAATAAMYWRNVRRQTIYPIAYGPIMEFAWGAPFTVFYPNLMTWFLLMIVIGCLILRQMLTTQLRPAIATVWILAMGGWAVNVLGADMLFTRLYFPMVAPSLILIGWTIKNLRVKMS